jgi:hypothetical protein
MVTKKKTKEQYQKELAKEHEKKRLYDESMWKKNNLGSTERNIIDAGKKQHKK